MALNFFLPTWRRGSWKEKRKQQVVAILQQTTLRRPQWFIYFACLKATYKAPIYAFKVKFES